MQKLSDTKDSPQAQTLETPEKSRAAPAFVFNTAFYGNTSKMSLPGLDLDAPDETVVTPTVHELKEQTEWRFEVAFGTKVEVRVRCPSQSALFYFNVWRITEFAAPLRQC